MLLFCEETQFFVSADSFQRRKPLEDEFRTRGQEGRVVLWLDPQALRLFEQTLDLLELAVEFFGGIVRGILQCSAQLEPLNNGMERNSIVILLEDASRSLPDDVAHHVVRPRISPSYSNSTLPVREGMAV